MRTFKQLDANGDGSLSKEELREGFINSEVMTDPAMVDLLFDQLDVNESGKVDYTEFISATIKTEVLITQEKVRAAFKLFDVVMELFLYKDRDGFITKEELSEVFGG